MTTLATELMLRAGVNFVIGCGGHCHLPCEANVAVYQAEHEEYG